MVFSLKFLPQVAKHFCDVVLAIRGLIKKCLILDLDNTLWGGIIGDDGIGNIQIGSLGIGKAFSEFQTWILELKKRGIILAVCSKNEEAIAKEPFEKHPDMILHLDDFSIFIANWENKADNIKYIQSILNIGFDSMVFFDDSPFERNMVRTHIPELTVPELPEDPAEYLSFVQYLNLFETASFVEEDEKRTAQYQEEAKRTIVRQSFSNEDDFLANLEMVCAVKNFQPFDFPRIAQLSQRSNQFNLRTMRYTEENVARIATSEAHVGLTFSLRDKFGDYGLIGIIILEKRTDDLFIDSFIMSCRILKRGMEQFILNELCAITKSLGYTSLTGEYLPTQKNVIVKDLYFSLGFTESNHVWKLDIQTYQTKKHFIKKV